HFQRAARVGAAATKRLGELNEIRQGRAQQYNAVMGQVHAAHRARYNEAADNWFNQWIAQEMPEFSKGKNLQALQRAANEEMRATGLSEAQIAHEWNYGTLRHPAAQQMITKLAYNRLLRENMENLRNNHRRHPPQPQAPGTWMQRGGDHDADIERLQRRL